MKYNTTLIIVIIILISSFLFISGCYADESYNLSSVSNISSHPAYATDRVIVKYNDKVASEFSALSLSAASSSVISGAEVIKDENDFLNEGMQVVSFPDSVTVEEAIDKYSALSSVEYAEPDYILYAVDMPVVDNYSDAGTDAEINMNNFTEEYSSLDINSSGSNVATSDEISTSSTVPNDTYFSYQYGLYNRGTSGADISAREAWDLITGSSSVIVAVVDSGVQYNHPDLAANCLPGYNFITNQAGGMDDNGHGTHCAGIIGAIGNNGVGVTGVNWKVKILPCKFLDSDGYGYTSDAVSAIYYARSEGASVISCSFSSDSYSQSLKDAIDSTDALVVCAAGNDYGRNIDTYPVYPASYNSDNIITVASTDSSDGLSSFSNIGLTSVDVGAPGSSIYSTYPTNSYAYLSGTSMATPYVSGIAALTKALNPDISVSEMRNAIIAGVDAKSSLTGKCVTGGRVNAYKTLLEVITFPVANYYGVPSTSVLPYTVSFYDASENANSWNWNFGDGNTSTEQNPVHTFYTAGNYNVTLEVEL